MNQLPRSDDPQAESLRDRSGRLSWWFPHHRDEAAEIVVALLARVFQNKKDHLADQMMAVVRKALMEYWKRVDADRALWLSRQLAAAWADGWITRGDWDGKSRIPMNPYDPPEPQ